MEDIRYADIILENMSQAEEIETDEPESPYQDALDTLFGNIHEHLEQLTIIK